MNFLCAITGPTGSGKTYSALKIAESLDPDFTIENVAFTAKEFMTCINNPKMKSGSVIIFDEAGVALSSRSWQSVQNKLLNYVLQTFRHRNYIVIFTAPHMGFVDAASRKLLHCYMETTGIDSVKKHVKLKPLLIQVSQRTSNPYYKYLRLVQKGKKSTPIKRFMAGLASEKLREDYEKKKTLYTTELFSQIMDEIDEADKSSGKLTDYQKEIMEGLKTENMSKLAVKMNINSTSVQQAVTLMKKKGYKFEPVHGEPRNTIRYYIIKNKQGMAV